MILSCKKVSLRRGSPEVACFNLSRVHEREQHLQALDGDGREEAHDVINRNALLGERVAVHSRVAAFGNAKLG
jgi:hypothetical protein